jgi:hypothetical protein
VSQRQELAEERLFRPAKQSHVRAIFSPAQSAITSSSRRS